MGHFALRAPSRRVWWVDFGMMEWGVMCAATTAAVGVIENAEVFFLFVVE